MKGTQFEPNIYEINRFHFILSHKTIPDLFKYSVHYCFEYCYEDTMR